MRLFKATAMALVLGAGMTFVSAHSAVYAQSSSSTSTISTDGLSQNDMVSGEFQSLQGTQTSTHGTGISAAIATPDFVASGGASLAGSQGASYSGSDAIEARSDNSFSDQYGGGSSTGSTTRLGGDYKSSGYSACYWCTDDGGSATSALNANSAWISAGHSSFVGSSSISSTGSSGPSVVALFVFGQSTDVPYNGELKDKTIIAPITYLADGALNNEAGLVTLKQIAGVGNEQGNNFGTVTELSSANGTPAGSNSYNLQSQQTIADAGEIEDHARMSDSGNTGEIAYIDNALSSMDGNVEVNQAAGVGNQKLNNVTLGR